MSGNQHSLFLSLFLFLLLFLSICVYVGVYACEYVGVYLHTCTCRDQSKVSGVFSEFCVSALREDLSLSCKPDVSVRLTGQRVLGICLSPHYSAGVTVMFSCVWLFTWVLGIQTRYHAGKASHLPNPRIINC